MASLRKAIDAHCRSCSYDEFDKGTWRYQAEHCPIHSCELYDLRPRITSNQAISQDKTEKQGKGTGGKV